MPDRMHTSHLESSIFTPKFVQFLPIATLQVTLQVNFYRERRENPLKVGSSQNCMETATRHEVTKSTQNRGGF